MTETDWLTGSDPGAMLTFLTADDWAGGTNWGPLATERKLRLWACACCRLVWDGRPCPEVACYTSHRLHKDCALCHGTGRVGGLTDPRSRNAVEVAEAFADGEATREECNRACREAFSADGCNWQELTDENRNAPCMACWTASTEERVSRIAERVSHYGIVSPAAQAALLRDVFGNPFRPVTAPCGMARKPFHNQHAHVNAEGGFWTESECPGCEPILSWNYGTVPRLARRIYDERRFTDLPVLADALEEAGCSDAAILGHLRETERPCGECGGTGDDQRESCEGDCPHCKGTGRLPAVHARGCWVLDLLLGKESEL